MHIPQFNYLPIEGHFGCFQFLVVKIAANNCVQFFFLEISFSFSGINAQEGVQLSYGSSAWFFRNCFAEWL